MNSVTSARREQSFIPINTDFQIPNTCSERSFRLLLGSWPGWGGGELIEYEVAKLRCTFYFLFNSVICENT